MDWHITLWRRYWIPRIQDTHVGAYNKHRLGDIPW